ncbi:hypothetical protein C8Q76DRAFT_175306 [Earliella scabrosa]|nr:hypothetical protein C8Q76DRAFT_175306 [Earliella scabrosa]
MSYLILRQLKNLIAMIGTRGTSRTAHISHRLTSSPMFFFVSRCGRQLFRFIVRIDGRMDWVSISRTTDCPALTSLAAFPLSYRQINRPHYIHLQVYIAADPLESLNAPLKTHHRNMLPLCNNLYALTLALRRKTDVVSVPLPSNVDPDWILPLKDGSGAAGFALWDWPELDPQKKSNMINSFTHYWDDLWNCEFQELVLAGPLDLDRCYFPGEAQDHAYATTIGCTSIRDFVTKLLPMQQIWFKRTLDRLPPTHWGNGKNDPVWNAWRQHPTKNAMMVVAIRRTLPDVHTGYVFYFPEMELRF